MIYAKMFSFSRYSHYLRKLVVAVLGVMFFGALPAMSATINVFPDGAVDEIVNGNCSLIEAINSANTDAAFDGCTAGSGADTIELPVDGTFTLVSVNNITGGNNGLPSVISAITINGNGTTIERSSVGGTPAFRLFSVSASLTVRAVVLRNGLATGDNSVNMGGAIRNTGVLTLFDSVVADSRARIGAGIENVGAAANATIYNSRIISNIGYGSGSGGGIRNASGLLTIVGSTISGNYAVNGGGGVMTSLGVLSISGSTISGNISRYGAGVLNQSSTSITNSTISGNDATCYAGGILTQGGLTVTNTTISGNIDSNTLGWASCADPRYEVAGVGRFAGNVIITNSIIANNTGSNCLGTLNNLGANLADDATCGTIPQSLSINLDPVLQDNGGPTKTHALLLGSSAIDAGDDAVCAGAPVNGVDQRGIARPQGAACDIGAIEGIFDTDGDGVLDDVDNCPTVYNPLQTQTGNNVGGDFGDACVDPNANISDKSDVSPDVEVGTNTTINQGVTILSGVELGDDVTVNKDASIGESSVVGDGTVINQGAEIGSDTVIGDNVTIGRNCVIGINVTIGNNTVIGQGCDVYDGVAIGANVTAGKDATIQADVPDGTSISKNTIWGPQR